MNPDLTPQQQWAQMSPHEQTLRAMQLHTDRIAMVIHQETTRLVTLLVWLLLLLPAAAIVLTVVPSAMRR